MTDRPASHERLIFAGTSDFAGLVRGKAFPSADLAERAVAGVGLTASNIMLSAFGPIFATPFGTLGDLKLVPDLSTRTAIPTAGETSAELALGDIRQLDDTEWSCCPRSFLRRALEQLRIEFGFTLVSAFEQEFVYTGVPVRPGSSYSFDRYRRAAQFAGTAMATLRSADIIPDSFLPEYGERQFEITVKPRMGIRAADEAVLLREIVRACALETGATATFAPVLEPGGIGNGTHIHWSLHDRDGHAIMHDPRATLGISAIARPFVAGVVAHIPAITALTAPSVASFFRLRPNKWAPVRANIGEHDRGAALRVCPIFARDAERAARQFNLEYRVADATASPYLALGAIVYAGLDGLRRQLDLPKHRLDDAADPERSGVQPLPQTLGAALDLLEQTEAARSWLGDEMLAAYCLFKRSEIAAVATLSDEHICERYVDVY